MLKIMKKQIVYEKSKHSSKKSLPNQYQLILNPKKVPLKLMQEMSVTIQKMSYDLEGKNLYPFKINTKFNNWFINPLIKLWTNTKWPKALVRILIFRTISNQHWMINSWKSWERRWFWRKSNLNKKEIKSKFNKAN